MNARWVAIFTGPALAGLALLALLDAAAKGAVILLVAAFAALVMRRASAASRHHVWLCALGCALVLPIASWMLPQWRVLPGWMRWEELPKRLMAAPAAQTVSTPVAVETTTTIPQPAIVDESSAAVLPPAPSHPTTTHYESPIASKPFRLDARWLLGGWACGSVVLLLPLALSAFALGQKCRRMQIVNDGTIAEAAALAQRDLGFRQRVRLLLGERDAMPMVWGVFRPCLLLPADAVEWTPQRLRAVLLHELAHLQRRDPLWQLVAHCGLALHWFNPLAWFAVRRLRIEQERACDDFVLRAGIRASEYAADMLAIVGSLRPAPFSAAALTMANLARLEGRITGILDGARNRRALTGWIAAAAVFIAIAIALPLAMLRAADERKADAASAGAQPKDKEAQVLFQKWQASARGDGKIPGGLIGRLGAKVTEFIRNNTGDRSGDPFAKKFEPLVARFDASHDWTPAEAVALLDAVAAVHTIPIEVTMEYDAQNSFKPAAPLPPELAGAPWGPPAANGLRAAWLLEPRAAEYPHGTSLKSRVLFHNSGKDTAVFVAESFNQPGHKARDAKGAEINISAVEWTTLSRPWLFRLAPGEFCEVWAPGVGVGARTKNEEENWADVRVGSWIEAKAGDDVTFAPGALSATKLDGRPASGDPQGAMELWRDIIADRVERELPLPTGATDREKILRSVTRDLFNAAPTPEEIAALIANKSPDAADALEERLLHRPGIAPFAGTLAPGEIKFRVAPADPEADKRPRVAIGPGRYTLDDQTRLIIVGNSVDGRRTSDVEIRFWIKSNPPYPPHKIEVPDGWGTWAIVCRPGEGFFYLLHNGGARKIDYSNPLKVTDTPANDLPAEFRDEVKRQLDIHGISDAQQAEIFEKPAPPAATPAPKTADASPPVAPAPGSVQPITDGRSSAQVLRAVGQEPVVILTGRALTASPDSTSREGSVTMEVATSDKTKTIRYTWPEDAPGFLDLKVGGYPVSRFDLSRGRVFFVHFEKLEFSADVFQVPAAVKVPAITSPETLTQAAAAVTAWHGASDVRALWECSRIVVPEREYKTGQPLDAAAEKIVWGEVNDVGLRLGLGGLEPGASFPVGQQLPVKQYIRNDSTNTLTFSPTQIFNEGVGGELVRMADGKKFPHKKGYPWQGFFHRVRLAPGHYIALGSGPMGTIMAEKDGSSPGGMDMMAHGFTVLPGEYTLQLTHDIGQLQGRPVNFHFADPRGAPGLGEWTGVLKSATVPLRLVDEQVKTARAGSSEAFGRYMIAFDKGVLKLRHYNGYPNMELTGGPWEDRSRDWKIPAADGEYVAAWAVGGKGVWVIDASGITHLIVKENLTETGRWTLDQASGGLGGMPAGVRAALQLPPMAASQPFDFTKLPNAPGAAKISGDFFEMALSPGTVLKVPHKGGGFFIESGGSAYGPAEGNPVVELGLTELLRARLTETPNTAGLDMLRHMIADGRGAIRDCGFRLLADLKAPQAPFDYDAVFHAMIHASIEDEDGPRELSPEARTGYTWFHNLFHTTRLEWERTRSLLAAGRYQPGKALGADTAIVWAPGPDGLSMGVSGLPAGTNLEIGKSVRVVVYLRNDSTAPVKLSVPSEHNPGIQISLTDAAGKTHRAIYPFSAPLTGYSHHELPPGTGAKVAAFDLEACATPEEADRAEHKEGKAQNPRLAVPPGSYELHLEYRNYQENPVPKGAASEWTGKVSAKPVPMKVAAATSKQQPAPEVPKSAAQAKPQHEYAQSLFKKWQASARTDGKIPGALIGQLARETDKAVNQTTDADISAKLAAVRSKLDASRDWTPAEVVAVLDEITAIATAPVSWANLPMEKQVQEPLKPAAPAPAAEKPKGAAAKLTPDGLLGFWRGERKGERMMLSFHRPPVETDAQLDIYFGDATIGSLARFTIAPDGGSAVVVMDSADSATFGTLRPGEAGKLELKLDGRQQGQMELTLTRDADEPANEPRQKEARELFDMWKRTANDDGTIPGTFIGMLAVEVRAYVKANPNLDSGMKLPKLLPRFVTSRNWTQAEAIKLLDDVAYYATAPIEARVAKAKLPSGALWRTMVPFEDIPVAIAKWSEAKDGLRIGMRVVEGEWRIGGKVRVELWLHNTGGKDVSFKTTGPDRQDVGVAVSAVGADGREHWAENGNVSIIAIPLHCTLPAGHVAKAKDVTLSFDAPDNKELAWMQPKFRELAPGKYKLRCMWSDPHPSVSSAGDWTGDLAAPEVEFTLAAQDAPKTVAERKLPPVDGPPVHPRLANDRYARSGVPLAEQTWPMPPWGAQKEGLSAGIRVIGDARIGGEVKVELWVRNSGAKDVKFSQNPRADVGLSIVAKDKDGKQHYADITRFSAYPIFHHLLLPPGHGVKVKEFSVKFGAKKNDKLEPGWVNLQLTPGDYKLHAKWSDSHALVTHADDWTGELTSGEVDFTLAGVAAQAAPASEKPKPEGAAANPAGKFRIANRTGKYDLGGGRVLYVCKPQEQQQRFSIYWPAADGSPKRSVKILPNVSKGVKWVVAFEQGADVLWWADESDVGKVRLSDPTQVIVDREGRRNNFSRDFALPDEVAEQFRAQGIVIGRPRGPGNEALIGGNTGGQQILVAQSVDAKQPEHAEADAAPVAFSGVAKLADSAYTKSGIPLGEFNAGAVNWSDEQNGLCVGMSVPEDAEWRIGGEVKVELWVCNPGEKDVKFQSIARRDIGLRVKMKGADGREHDAAIAIFDTIPLGDARLLPAGHIVKVKDFSAVFSPPATKESGIEPQFTLPAGDYKFRCELDLPGFSRTNAEGKQTTPAEGEWTGTLKSGELDVKLLAAAPGANAKRKDAATVPPGEGEIVFITRDSTRPFAKLDAGDGVTVEINERVVHGADVMTTAIIRWPARDGHPALRHDESIALDAFGNRDKWALGWVSGTKTLWHVNTGADSHRYTRLHRAVFEYPQSIVTEYDANYPNEPIDGLGISPELRAKFEQFFDITQPKVMDKSGGLPEISGQAIHAARPVNADGSVPPKAASQPSRDKRWKVQFVDGDTGKPMPRVRARVHVQVADGSSSHDIVRFVNEADTFEPSLDGEQFATVEVLDEQFRGGGADHAFGNVPASLPTAAKNTDSEKPFVVKVWPRAKQAAPAPAGKLRVANGTGTYDLGGGRTLYICKPDEEQQRFSVFWPATTDWPKCSVKILPNVAKGAKWAVVWELGAKVLWWADDSDVGKLRLTEPAKVLVDREGRENNFSRDFGLSDAVKEEFRKLGFVIGRDKTPGRELLIGGNTGGQTILSAQTLEEWIVEGTVTDADGKPLANVPITARSEYRPTVDLATAKTDAQGRYGVVFPLDLETLAKWRGIEVRPALAGFTERELARSGGFHALLFGSEQPQRVPHPVRGINEEFKPGPIPRFGEHDLVAAQPGRADFVMLPAGEIVGRIVTTEGTPLPNYFISLAAPQQLAGFSVASTTSDERGQFRLAGIPTNQPLIFTANPGGNPSATIKSAPQKFETAKIANVRIVMPPQESGAPLKIERTEGAPDPKAAAASSETPAPPTTATSPRREPSSVVAMRGYLPGVGESRELIEHCHAIAAAHGRPQATGAELVAWGDETRGLRAGLLMAPRAELGVPLTAWIVIRNVSKDTVTVPLVLSWNTTPVVAWDAEGNPVAVSNPQLRGGDAILQCLLKPGEQVEMKTQPIQFGGEKGDGTVSRVEIGTGKCQVNFDLSRADRRQTPEAAFLGRFKTLATGRATVEVSKGAPRRAGFSDDLNLKEGSAQGEAAVARAGSAQEVLDGIAAVVNDEVITFSQLRELVAPLEKAAREQYKGNELVEKIKEIRLKAIKDLIDRQLILQKGEARLELERAEATLARLTKLHAEKLVGSEELDEARSRVEVLKAEIAGDIAAANRARLAQVEAEFKRVTELHNQSLISQYEVDKAKTQLEVLKAEIAGDKTAANRARLAQVEAELKRVTELHNQNLISQYEVDKAKLQLEVLKAEIADDKTAANRARLAHAEAELKRVTELHNQKLISSEQFDQAKTNVEVRRAELAGDRLAATRAQLAHAEAQLKRVESLREQKLVAEAEYESAKAAVEVARLANEAAKAPPAKRSETPIVVEIHADGTIHIGEKKFSITELETHLVKLHRDDPALAVALIAEKTADYASVNAVLDVLKRAAISKATLQPKPSASDNAPASRQKWIAAGRVTDKDGKPIEGVLISVDAGMGSLFQTGKATTGADGRYTVEFTQGMMMEKDSPGLQFANVTAHKPRFFEKNLNRHGAGAMALREVAADELKGYGIAADALALPGRARTVDFVMLPAARIKGRLLGTGNFSRLTPAQMRNQRPGEEKLIAGSVKLDHAPLAGWQLWLKGQALPPGASVICTTRTDKDGNFVMEDVPTGFEWQFLGETNRSDVREVLSRQFFKLRNAADYSISLDLPEKQDNFEIKVTADGISYDGKATIEISNPE